MDVGDVDLQHRDADQRAAVGAFARCGAACMSALGAFAFGSAFWGVVSSVFGLQAALTIARWRCSPACCWRGPSRCAWAGAGRDAGGTPWEDFFVAHEPDPQAGPVAVEIAYRIRAEDAPRFSTRWASCARRVAATARRSGASTATWAIRRATANASSSPAGPTTCTSAPRDAGGPGARVARARFRAGRRSGDDAALHRRAMSEPLAD